MHNRKIKKCEQTVKVVFILKILTNLYSKCLKPCSCFHPTSCSHRGIAEKYFTDSIKPALEALFGENSFKYGVYVYEYKAQYMFKFFVYISDESTVKKDRIIRILKGLRKGEKKIRKYHIKGSGE